GAILAICPQATLVDLTHEISPGDVAAGARALMDSVEVFPAGTVHVTVVDPGVGSRRRAVAAEIGDWRFVGPDNGLFSLILKKFPLRRAVELRNSAYWRPNVSPVFHGRDLFGPVAAHWSAGRDITDFGPLLSDQLVTLDFPIPEVTGELIHGEIVGVDRFGNL